MTTEAAERFLQFGRWYGNSLHGKAILYDEANEREV